LIIKHITNPPSGFKFCGKWAGTGSTVYLPFTYMHFLSCIYYSKIFTAKSMLLSGTVFILLANAGIHISAPTVRHLDKTMKNCKYVRYEGII
jgi:hypothetical protein